MHAEGSPSGCSQSSRRKSRVCPCRWWTKVSVALLFRHADRTQAPWGKGLVLLCNFLKLLKSLSISFSTYKVERLQTLLTEVQEGAESPLCAACLGLSARHSRCGEAGPGSHSWDFNPGLEMKSVLSLPALTLLPKNFYSSQLGRTLVLFPILKTKVQRT